MTSEITETEPVVARTSLWEDFVDIFMSPSEVFARRRDGRFGWALAVLTVLLTVLGYAFYSALSAAFEADFVRGIAQAGQDVDQVPLETVMAFSRNAAIFGSIVMVPLGVLFSGIGLWIVARLFGAKIPLLLTVTIATFATFPRILATVGGILQGILLNPDSMTRISFGPARFLDPATTSQTLLAFAGRIDLFVLWSLILTAIGLKVIGGMSQSRAYMASLLVWVIGSLFLVVPLLVSSGMRS